MRDQRVADRSSGTRNEIDHSGRQTDLVQEIDENRCDHRSIARWFEHDRITGDERRRRHPGHDCERKIPRRNHDADAERNIAQHVFFAADRHERRRFVVTQRFAGVEFHEVDRFGRVGVGFRPALSDLEHEQRVEIIAALTNELRGAEQNLRALLCARVFPRRKVAERRLDRFVRLFERSRSRPRRSLAPDAPD